MDAAAQTDPVHPVGSAAETILDPGQHFVEPVEIAVFAVVVEHHAADAVRDGFRSFRVLFAKTAEGARGVGQIEAEVETPGSPAGPRDMPALIVVEAVQLPDGC